MARPRLELQNILGEICDNVYFQPPPSIRMTYPAIVYSRDYRFTMHADNGPYSHTKRYQVTVIARDPDSEIPDLVADLPLAAQVRAFASDGLNHDIFDLYF